MTSVTTKQLDEVDGKDDVSLDVAESVPGEETSSRQKRVSIWTCCCPFPSVLRLKRKRSIRSMMGTNISRMKKRFSSSANQTCENPDRALFFERRQAGIAAAKSRTWKKLIDALSRDEVDVVRSLSSQVEILLALPVWRNTNGEGLLHVLSRTGAHEMIDAILSSCTPKLRDEILNRIVERGRGLSPLHVASSRANIEAVRVLIQHGATARHKVDNYGLTPLHRACGAGNIETCRLLLDAGSDAFYLDKTGFTAWHRACFHGHMEVLKLIVDTCKRSDLLQYMSSLEQELTGRGRSSLHLVAQFVKKEDVIPEILRILVEEVGIPVDLLSKDLRTPIHEACTAGNLSALRELVALGGDPNIRVNGNTPLHLAVQNSRVDVCRALLQLPDTETLARNRNGLTPKQVAVETSKFDVLAVFDDPEIIRIRMDANKGLTFRRASLVARKLDSLLSFNLSKT